MVHGLLPIEHADELCEVCLVGKQHQASFPEQAWFRATCALELSCSDDMSKYMWITLLMSKDEVAVAIKNSRQRLNWNQTHDCTHCI